MFYKVTARLRPETAAELHRKLNDGTIRYQKPDGGEILAGMNGAVIAEDGSVEFSMACYCSTPLAHERATVFDEHFYDLTTESVDGYLQLKGQPFLDYLSEFAP